MAQQFPAGGPNQSGSSFRQRLGWYLMGVAIGLVLVGMIFQARAIRSQRMQAAQQAQQQQQQPQPQAGQESAP
jgi:flagellar biosynthesis/type III secretory pathway M-ring protein FliF/YscJ